MRIVENNILLSFQKSVKAIKVISIITIIAFTVMLLGMDMALAFQLNSPNVSKSSEVKTLDLNTFMLPKNLGTVQGKWSSPGERATIIHIQDAHCNYFAQKQISQILAYLSENYGIRAVNLEGGSGEYDFSVFADIENSKTREGVADYFVDQGIVSGSEFYAINNPSKVNLWGVEDIGLYLKSLNVYKDSLRDEARIEEFLSFINEALNVLKLHIFSEELIEMDLKNTSYREGDLSFKEYLEFVVNKARSKDIQIRDFSNIAVLEKTLSKEDSIDFEQAEKERGMLIDRIQRMLSQRQLEELVIKTIEFESKAIDQDDFYNYLFQKAKVLKIDLALYPELIKYSEYISTYKSIDSGEVIGELKDLDEMVRGLLFDNEEQGELYLLTKNFTLMNNIFDLELTKSDYEYYEKNKSSFNIEKFISFIEAQNNLYGIDYELPDGMEEINAYREDLEGFFEYSFKRDKAFLKNIKFGALGKNQGQAAVLVTGGFHAENLNEMFKKKNISYISIMPKFTCPEGYESPYFELLAGKGRTAQPLLAEVSLLALYSDFSQNAARIYGEDAIKAKELWVKLVAAIYEHKTDIQVGDRLYSFGETPSSSLVEGVVVDGVQVYAKNVGGDEISVVEEKISQRDASGIVSTMPGLDLMGKFTEIEPLSFLNETGKLVGKLRNIDTGEVIDLSVVGQETVSEEELAVQINRMKEAIEHVDASPEAKKILDDIVDSFLKNMPGQIVLTDAGTKGFFGIARKGFLVVDGKLRERSPLALLHEIIEYVKHADTEMIKSMDSVLDNSPDNAYAGGIWLKKHEEKYKSQGKEEYFSDNRDHYVIRAFTRQTFGKEDERLTRLIKDRLAEVTFDIDPHKGAQAFTFVNEAWIKAGNSAYRVWIQEDFAMMQRYDIQGGEPRGDVHENYLGKSVSVGRNDANTYTIADEGLSHYHFEFSLARQGEKSILVIEDFESTNGTKITYAPPSSANSPALGKGALWFVADAVFWLMNLLGISIILSRDSIVEDAVVPVVEEGSMFLGLVFGGPLLYVGIRLSFIILHVFQNRAPPVGRDRTLFEKTAIPALASSAAIIPLVLLGTTPIGLISVAVMGTIVHMLANRYVTVTGSRLQKGDVGLKGSNEGDDGDTQEVTIKLKPEIGETFTFENEAWIKAGNFAYKVWTEDGFAKMQRHDFQGVEAKGDVHEYSLGTTVSVGKADDNSYKVSDKVLSRYHFQFSLSQRDGKDVLVVEDLGSTNGTEMTYTPVKADDGGIQEVTLKLKPNSMKFVNFENEVWVNAGSFSYKIWVEKDATGTVGVKFQRYNVKDGQLVGGISDYPTSTWISVGRATDNEYSINDRGLSEKHFQFLVRCKEEAKTLVIKDLESSQGTVVVHDALASRNRLSLLMKKQAEKDQEEKKQKEKEQEEAKSEITDDADLGKGALWFVSDAVSWVMKSFGVKRTPSEEKKGEERVDQSTISVRPKGKVKGAFSSTRAILKTTSQQTAPAGRIQKVINHLRNFKIIYTILVMDLTAKSLVKSFLPLNYVVSGGSLGVGVKTLFASETFSVVWIFENILGVSYIEHIVPAFPFLVGAVVCLILLPFLQKQEMKIQVIGAKLALAGSLSHLVDLTFFKAVIDWIYIPFAGHAYLATHLADISMVAGLFLVVVGMPFTVISLLREHVRVDRGESVGVVKTAEVEAVSSEEELSPFGFADALGELTPVSGELKEWKIRYEEWRGRLNKDAKYNDLKSEEKEVLATIMAFQGMENVADKHIQSLLEAFGVDADRAPPLDDPILVEGIIAYFSETRPGYAEALAESQEKILASLSSSDEAGRGVDEIGILLSKKLSADVLEEHNIDMDKAIVGIQGFVQRRKLDGHDDRIVIKYIMPGETRGRGFMLKEGTEGTIALDLEDIKDLSENRYIGARMEVITSFSDKDEAAGKQLSLIAEKFLKGLTANKTIKILRNTTGDDTIEFEDLGKKIYISDHMWGASKDIFKVVFQSKKGRDIELTVATKREKSIGDITKNEIRDIIILQDRPGHVVPRFGVETSWDGKRWYVEEFVEGETVNDLDLAGRFTVDMRKKVVGCLLSISVGLGGMVPADMNGGNFIISRDVNEAVMVDLGGRRFRVFGKASKNIEKEEARFKHKIVFLATLMSQIGFFNASPEENHFIFETIANDKSLGKGEGLELLTESYKYLAERQAQDPDFLVSSLNDLKFIGGFKRYFSAMNDDIHASKENSKERLKFFADDFMNSLRSYLSKTESRRGPPAAIDQVESEDDVIDALGAEVLSRDFEIRYKAKVSGRANHMATQANDIEKEINKLISKYVDTNIIDGEVTTNAVDGIFQRFDNEFIGYDEQDISEYEYENEVRITGVVTLKILRNDETGAISIVVSDNGSGIPHHIVKKWRDEFESTKAVIPDDGEDVYDADVKDFFFIGGRNQGINTILGKALDEKYKLSYISKVDTDQGMALRFTQEADDTISKGMLRKAEQGTTLIVTIPAEAPLEVDEALSLSPEKLMYDTARKMVPEIVKLINRDAPTYDIAPADFEGQSKVVNMLNQTKRITGRRGHNINASFYTFGSGEDWVDNLKNRIDANLDKFYLDLKEKPTTRMTIRLLEGNDKRSEVKDLIIEKLTKIIGDSEGIDLEKARIAATEIFDGKVLLIGEYVEGAEHLNNVIDLFADIAMMEVHRYQKGDYLEESMPDSLKTNLTGLLRSSVMNLEGLTVKNITEVLEQIFNGSIILEMRKVNWESIREWKAANDSILMSL